MYVPLSHQVRVEIDWMCDVLQCLQPCIALISAQSWRERERERGGGDGEKMGGKKCDFS